MSLIRLAPPPRRAALFIGPLGIWIAWPPVRWHGRRGWYDHLYISDPRRMQTFSKVWGPFYWRSNDWRIDELTS